MKKAITVLQPWATLLVTGNKRCETRSWRTNYRGEIFIHAGKRDSIFGICSMGENAWEIAAHTLDLRGVVNRFEHFPTGAIIGKAKLVNCVLIDEAIASLIQEQHPEEFVFGDFTPGRYAWVMEDALVFSKPIPISGKQGLWNCDGEILRE